MILIIGSEGSMGKRYQSILKYLGETFNTIDSDNMSEGELKRYHRFIIASPTDTHIKWIFRLLPFGKPILCEKPITKDLDELKNIIDMIRRSKCDFRMMTQYQELLKPIATGNISSFDYFKHGNDGLVWDCIQIIAFANSQPTLKESSPIWYCMINDQIFDLSDMDMAYIKYVERWFKEPMQDLDWLYEIHKKTKALTIL